MNKVSAECAAEFVIMNTFVLTRNHRSLFRLSPEHSKNNDTRVPCRLRATTLAERLPTKQDQEQEARFSPNLCQGAGRPRCLLGEGGGHIARQELPKATDTTQSVRGTKSPPQGTEPSSWLTPPGLGEPWSS